MQANWFFKFIKKQSFQPNFFSIFLNPYFIIRRGLSKDIAAFASDLQGKMMDFGCGRKPYQNLLRVQEYIGVDIETTGHDHTLSQVDIYYDGKTIPVPDNSFDSIFCSEVMEHIFNPDQIFQELFRVLKPGGKILITVPFCWNEHEIPFDYGRYSSYGIKDLVSKHGFKIMKFKKNGNFIRVLFQLAAVYILGLFKKLGRAGTVISLVFITPVNLLSIILSPLFPVNNTLYFNNVLVAEKPLILPGK